MLNFIPKRYPHKEKNRKQVLLFFMAMLSILSMQAQCPAVNVPYLENFESAEVPDMPACTSIENGGGDDTWLVNDYDVNGFVGNHLMYDYASDGTGDDWFFTRGVNLVANTTYKISYDYGSADEYAEYVESLKVAYGTSASSAGMTFPLADHPEITAGLTPNTVIFTPTTSGVYYFGFKAYSQEYQMGLLVDNISIIASLPPVITNFTSTAACGQSTLLTINGTNLLNATVKIGGTPITLQTNTDAQITTMVSSAIAGPVAVTTSLGTATSTSNFSFIITPSITLSGTLTTICSGAESEVVTVASGSNSYTTYTWTPSAGVAGNSTSGWTFNPSAATVYVLNASNAATGCTNKVDYLVGVTNLPTPVTVNSPALNICQHASSAVVTAASTLAPVNSTVAFSFGSDIELPGGEEAGMAEIINATLSLNKTIALPVGAVVTSTKLVFSNVTTENTYVEELEASLSGAITLASTMVAEIDDEVTNGGPYEIVTGNIPNTGGTVSLTLTNTYIGPATFGNISLVVEYTVPVQLNLTWWDAPTGGTQIGTGATLETVGTSVLPATATPGTYTVYAQASNGSCSATPRTAAAVTVKANPAPVITAPSLAVCDGSSIVLTSSATSGNVWSTNATSNSITVTTAGSYTVTVTENGCIGTSAPAVVTTGTTPVAGAALTGDITITATPAGQAYQWINCTTNAVVSGETGAIFTAPANGSYKVIVTNTSGCKDTSACVNVSKVGLDENSVDIGVSLYPNPTEGNVYLTMTETEKADVIVLDAQGKVVLKMNNIQDAALIDMNHTQKGIYLVKVSNAKGTNVFRMVKK